MDYKLQFAFLDNLQIFHEGNKFFIYENGLCPCISQDIFQFAADQTIVDRNVHTPGLGNPITCYDPGGGVKTEERYPVPFLDPER